MNWYIVQAYSGFEKKVVESIREELKKHKLEENIGEILVPTHQITQVKKGKRTKKILCVNNFYSTSDVLCLLLDPNLVQNLHMQN